jgi:hypothetical protein
MSSRNYIASMTSTSLSDAASVRGESLEELRGWYEAPDKLRELELVTASRSLRFSAESVECEFKFEVFTISCARGPLQSGTTIELPPCMRGEPVVEVLGVLKEEWILPADSPVPHPEPNTAPADAVAICIAVTGFEFVMASGSITIQCASFPGLVEPLFLPSNAAPQDGKWTVELQRLMDLQGKQYEDWAETSGK